MNLLEFAKRKTKSYDASDSKITIAGIPIDSIIKAELKVSESFSYERGISRDYYTPIKKYEIYTLDLTILPISKCYDKLKLLKSHCDINNTYFGIVVVDNGGFVGNFDAHFTSMENITIALSPEDKTFSFSMIAIDNIQQPISRESEESIQQLADL